MTNEYTREQAKKLIVRHVEILNGLKDGWARYARQREAIKDAAMRMVRIEVLKYLRTLPIEEFNRDKQGTRLKPLKDLGYTTVGDLVGKSVAQLAQVDGISEDNARVIIYQIANYVEMLEKATKIGIDADRRTKAATELVKAITVYLCSLNGYKAAKELYSANCKTVAQAIKDLRSASGLKSFTANGETKRRANEAYALLSSMAEGDYGARAGKIVSELKERQNVAPEKAWATFMRYSVRYYNVLEQILPGVLGNDDEYYGLPEDLAHEILEQAFDDQGLNCELRNYQKMGAKYILHQGRVLLGDEMGLGKTVQAIASMVCLHNFGETHFLVVCPLSVLKNWIREIRTKSTLNAMEIYGSDRDAELQVWLDNGGVAVTNYETTENIRLDDDFRFGMIVVDEAHMIKNPSTIRTINTVRLSDHADRTLFMTGTALENNVEEMLSLLRILRPDVEEEARKVAFMYRAPEFRKIIAPVYYRRKRDEVLTELPEKTESNEWCVLTPEDRKAYEAALLSRNFSDVRRVSFNTPEFREHSCKLQRLKELVEEAKSEDRKVIVFSYFRSTIDVVAEVFRDCCMQQINGDVSPQRRQEIIDEFEDAPGGTVLPAQILAAGTGLNIQCASVVVLCEPQLKPSIENQAISRAYRMGQTRKVLVYRLLCDGTVDERILTLLAAKQKEFDRFADQSEAAKVTLDLTKDELGRLIDEEIERISGSDAGTEDAPPEGTGETPPEGTGETPPEGTGETPPEGTGETPPEGTGETPPEGAGETPPEGTGEAPPEGTGETPSEGAGETPPEGAGETPPEGTGEAPQNA